MTRAGFLFSGLFCKLPYIQHLEQCVAYRKCSLTMCWRKWVNEHQNSIKGWSVWCVVVKTKEPKIIPPSAPLSTLHFLRGLWPQGPSSNFASNKLCPCPAWGFYTLCTLHPQHSSLHSAWQLLALGQLSAKTPSPHQPQAQSDRLIICFRTATK